MWYVMQVMSRQEGRTVRMLEQSLSREILTRCLIPMRRRKKKFHGQWQEVTEMLFPGYVFLVTDTPQLLYDELKNVPAMTKLLGSCEEPFTPLSEPDVQFLMKLQGDKDIGETGLSQVAVGEGRQVRILSGPLKNLEGKIQKINLHKRIAIVETEFMGNRSLLHLGIEIVNEVCRNV